MASAVQRQRAAARPRIGVFLPSAQFSDRSVTEALDSTVATAVAAEEAGFDEVWVAEHHFQTYGTCPSALTMAGYLLGATRRIVVGTAVTVLTTQHPVAVAEQALLLDQVSRGRLQLGVGRGGPWWDLQVFAAPAGRYEAGFAEALDIVSATVAGREVAGSSAWFTFPAVTVTPPPRSPSGPPVLVAATTPRTVDMAAARGLPLLLGMHADDGEKSATLARYGVGTPDHLGVGIGYVADTDQEAEAVLSRTLPRWLGPGLASYRRCDGRPHRTRDPHAYTAQLCRIHPVGSPARCRDRLTTTMRETGLSRFALMVEGVGDLARSLENVRRLGDEVVARVRSAVDEVKSGVSGDTRA